MVKPMPIGPLKGIKLANGFNQTRGLDFHETFTLVAKLNSIRVILSQAAIEIGSFQLVIIKNAKR